MMKKLSLIFIAMFSCLNNVVAQENNLVGGKSRDLILEKQYLNFPVKNGAKKCFISLIIDGRVVREFEIEPAPDEPDFWVFLDIGEFRNQKATLRIDKFEPDQSKGFDSIYQADTFKGRKNLYREKLRPQFHFTSRRGWNNDSNGLVYYDGEYHLFYQHNPYGWKWGNMTWGHAISNDIVHWKELGDAIHPDRLGTIFSGSAVVDVNNTAGFQTGDEKVLVCIYTSAGGRNPLSEGQPFTQSIAYSNDRGRSWTVYKDNPIIGHISGSNRDPKVIWHIPTRQWVMALYMDKKIMGFFTSDDLKSWEFQSKIECFHECPELFELPFDGDENNKNWILYGGSGEYLIGDFDGKQFKSQTAQIPFHYGNCFYASQTFNNIPEKDGRRIQIAWGRVAMPGMPFNQMMLFPVTLRLQTTEEGPRMFAEPIREIEKIHEFRWQWRNETLKPGSNLLSNISGELFHIQAEIKIDDDAEETGFVIRDVPVVYNVQKQQLSYQKKTSPLKPVDGKIRLEILVDRTSIEIFGNHGRMYMPIGVILADNSKSLEIFTKGGNTKIESLDVYKLGSIWR
jgi:fructan beta-fructosidase